MNKPFLPSDLPKADPLRDWRRALTAKAFAASRGVRFERAVEDLWPGERGAVETLTRATVSPTMLGDGTGALAGGRPLAAFLASLAPQSAAARLFAMAVRVNMDGLAVVGLPQRATRFPDPTFVAEGAPIPAIQGSFGNVTLGPPRKLAAFAGVMGELSEYSAEDAETIIQVAIGEAAAHALDGAVFDSSAASDVRPAGLLHGVSPIAAATLDAGGGSHRDAMAKDMAALVGALADAGGGTNVMFVTNPRQAVTAEVQMGANAPFTVIPSPALAAGTIIAVEVGAIASGFAGLPEFEVSKEATIHYEDTAPLAIGTAGSPATVAAPVRSAFQTYSLVIRMLLRCAWAMRLAGGVQYLTGANW